MVHDSFDDEGFVDWREILHGRNYFYSVSHDSYEDYTPQFQASVRERALFHAWIFIGCLLTGVLCAIAYSYLR